MAQDTELRLELMCKWCDKPMKIREGEALLTLPPKYAYQCTHCGRVTSSVHQFPMRLPLDLVNRLISGGLVNGHKEKGNEKEEEHS